MRDKYIGNDPEIKINNAMAEAYEKALESLSRYKFLIFGYWAAQWVLLNKLLPHPRPNPFSLFVKLARFGPVIEKDDIEKLRAFIFKDITQDKRP